MRLIEVCGLAGSGKSTVCRLCEQKSKYLVRCGYRLPLGYKLGWLPLAGLNLLPILLKGRVTQLSLTHYKMFLYLEMLAIHFSLRKTHRWGFVILDQGPIYIHAALKARWGLGENSDGVTSWLEANLRRWGGIIDGVIWLDATDTVILERVSVRSKKHFLKLSDGFMRAKFLENYRAAYRDILSLLGTWGVPIFPVRTDMYTPGQTAGLICEFIASV